MHQQAILYHWTTREDNHFRVKSQNSHRDLQGLLGQSLCCLSLNFWQASLLSLELARKAHNWGSLYTQFPCLDWSSWGWLSACLAPSTPSSRCSNVTFSIRFFLNYPPSPFCALFLMLNYFSFLSHGKLFIWKPYICFCEETPKLFFLFYVMEVKIRESDTWFHSKYLVNSLTLAFEQWILYLLVLFLMNWFVYKGIFMTLDIVNDDISLI